MPLWSAGTDNYTRSVTSSDPAAGNYSFQQTTTGGGNFYQGTYTNFAPAQPSSISWYAKTNTTNASNGYFVAGDGTIASDNGIIFCYFNAFSELRFFNTTGYNHPISANTWYLIEARDIDYVNRHMDIYLNGELILTNWAFRSSTATHFDRIHLFSLSPSIVEYDDIRVGEAGFTTIATPSTQSVCSELPIEPIVLSGASEGATYNWSRDNTAEVTGIAASGTGDINGTLLNTTNAPITVTFTIYADYYGSCAETPITATIIVNPEPDITANPNSQTICNNGQTNIALSSNVSETAFSWIVQSTSGSVSGQSSGSGNIIAQNLVNSGTSAATVIYRITPATIAPDNCAGPFTDVSITVSPSPELTCPGMITANTSTDGTGNCSGTAYWNHPSISPDVCGPVVMNMSIDGSDPVSVTPGADAIQTLTVGSHQVTYSVMDGAANSDVCSFTISIVDDENPLVSCSNQFFEFNGETEFILNPEELVTASDNCAVQSIILNPTTVYPQQIGQSTPFTATVTDVNGNSSTCTANINISGLPSGWSQSVNGINCNDGSNIAYNPTNQVWTATSTNCFYSSPFTSDAMSYAQHTLCGDGSITAQVTGIIGTSFGWAGIIMRENNEAGAKKVQLTTNRNSNLLRREVRSVTNGQAFPQQFPAQNRFWLRIVRTGNQFMAYSSPNGVNWFPVMSVNVAMNSCIEVGLVLSNYSQNSTVSSTFSNVTVVGNFNYLASINQNIATADLSEKSNDFEVYPNPTNGELYIDLPSFTGKAVKIELYNMQGQMLQFLDIDNAIQNQKELLNLTGLAPGMYFVMLKSDGLPDATKRVILQGNQNRP